MLENTQHIQKRHNVYDEYVKDCNALAMKPVEKIFFGKTLLELFSNAEIVVKKEHQANKQRRSFRAYKNIKMKRTISTRDSDMLCHYLKIMPEDSFSYTKQRRLYTSPPDISLDTQ